MNFSDFRFYVPPGAFPGTGFLRREDSLPPRIKAVRAVEEARRVPYRGGVGSRE